ncbi:MAG: alpha/beta hydrolase [Deltaproteobacteria bacterium]|nr:alpha/beta hydrolase [Deltaproteobacteria bacterium]MBI3386390.1 alpha/beta hydrolase [Deltaproteobacteria bacterium]
MSVGVAGLATGCAPLVGVKHLSARDVGRSYTSNVLSTDDLSDATRIALRRHNLVEQFDDKPEDALAQLHRAVLSEGAANDDLFALAELSFFHAERGGKQSYYLAAAVYSFAFLFPEDATHRPVAMDPRYRWACDVYDRALTLGFKAAKGDNIEPRAGRYQLPFGVLNVEFDETDLTWGNRRLKDFVPVAELEVIGLRNRYRSHGIGAPLAATTERTGSSQPGDDFVGPFVRIPLTAVLLLEHPRQQLVGPELSATLRLIAANSADTIAIGTETVPLENDRTAAIATTLAANSMLENELFNFLGNATGMHGQSRLAAREPFQPGRIPVVFVHGTNSSPARWADMVNDLEADPWVRQHYQFWFFSYDSGNPIAYSAMLLRRALKKGIQTYDPEGRDPCLQHMIVIGHSQGGLLTKMTVIDSGDRFWRNVSDTPIDQLHVSEDTRALVQEAMFVEPLPFVSRVVFISTPHRGSYLAGPELVRRVVQKLVSMPSTLVQTGADLFSKDDVKPYLKMQTLPTAIDNMSPGHPFIRTIAEIPVAPGVHAHSIISVDGDVPKESGGDGVVKYVSAHIDGVESEYVVNSPHSCQSNADTIDEVDRILHLHAADVACGRSDSAASAPRSAVEP